MILGIEPFLRNRTLKSEDLSSLGQAITRAGNLTGGGLSYATAGPQNPSVYVVPEPKRIRGFWGKIFITTGDYTDERYKIYRRRATGGTTTADQLTTEDDPPPEDAEGNLTEDWPITATNRAEMHDHTHTLPDGMEVWVTAEVDYSENPVVHYSFFAVAPGGVTVKNCPASTSISASSIRFAGGFTVTDAGGGEVDIFPNVIPDPAKPGITIDNGDGISCQAIKIGLDCSAFVADVRYTGGNFEKLVCGVWSTVFSTSACPTPAGGVAFSDFGI